MHHEEMEDFYRLGCERWRIAVAMVGGVLYRGGRV